VGGGSANAASGDGSFVGAGELRRVAGPSAVVHRRRRLRHGRAGHLRLAGQRERRGLPKADASGGVGNLVRARERLTTGDLRGCSVPAARPVLYRSGTAGEERSIAERLAEVDRQMGRPPRD